MSKFQPNVIPPGREAALATMLNPPGGLPEGWRFAGARIEYSRVVATYARERDRAVVALMHPQQADGGGIRTASFVLESASTCEVAPLVSAIAASVRRLETGWSWHQSVDIELLAVVHGAKPAVRVSIPPEESDAMRQHMIDAGLDVDGLERTVVLHGVARRILYASRDVATAHALRRAETLVLFGAVPAATRIALTADIGQALGYPECCIAAFQGRYALRFERDEAPTDALDAASSAWVARPAARLNDQLFGEGQGFISFEPCRYDCEAALDRANRTADVLDEAAPDTRRQVDEALAIPVLVHASGARARLELDRTGPSPVLVRAEALRRERHAAVPDEDRATARAYEGREIPDDGRLDAQTLVIDFGLSRPAS